MTEAESEVQDVRRLLSEAIEANRRCFIEGQMVMRERAANMLRDSESGQGPKVRSEDVLRLQIDDL